MPKQTTIHLCLSCGLPFEVLLAEVKRGSGKYCSNRCVGDANRRGVNLVDCVCRQCGITFQIHHSRVVLGEGLYCSRRCVALANRVPIEDRFWTHVQRCPHDEGCLYCCWPWLSKKNRLGYGRILSHRKEVFAHRISWTLHHGTTLPPAGLVIRHLCNNPPCCNPSHLAAGSVQDNANDRVRSGRSLKGEQHPLAKLSDTDIPHIYALRQQDMTVEAIAAQYGVSTATIIHICQLKTWQHLLPEDAVPIQGQRVGIRHQKAKFTEDDIRTIRALHASGENCVALGKRFHASDETIRMIVLRKTWRHIS